MSLTKTEKPRKRKLRLVIFIFILVIGFPLIGGTIAYQLTFDDDGVWNPDPNNERFRRNEYDTDSPFFQWWYFSLKDYTSNRTFAFCYMYSDTTSTVENEGSFLTFAMVDDANTFNLMYNFSLSDFQHENDFDITLGLNSNNQEIGGQLNVVNDNQYHISGNMNQSSSTWAKYNIAANTKISWDLDIFRIVGWYGQQDLEPLIQKMGIISWNTYSYDSEVMGEIWINETRYQIDRSEQFRMYCDMNWGENFPSGNPAIEHPWGWFLTTIPNSDPSLDVAIIAGVGRHDTETLTTKTGYGKFASLHLIESDLGLRYNDMWNTGEESGIPVVKTCGKSNGKLQTFRIDKYDWYNFTDPFGTALIPLNQIVTLETTYLKVVMNFTSEPRNYNRLLFPTEGCIFSDFEALGVKCETKIYEKTYASSDIFKSHPIQEQTACYIDHQAGLEYGYSVAFDYSGLDF